MTLTVGGLNSRMLSLLPQVRYTSMETAHGQVNVSEGAHHDCRLLAKLC
jgi:hypothetical protein